MIYIFIGNDYLPVIKFKIIEDKTQFLHKLPWIDSYALVPANLWYASAKY